MTDATMTRDALSHHDIPFAYNRIIDDICDFDWPALGRDDMINVAWAYYYFSIQFRENLEIACSLFPDDVQLAQLNRGERHTDNLSPWPGVAASGERMNHDEFMRRTLQLAKVDPDRRRALEAIGDAYLAKVRKTDRMTRSQSLASYEDGGLERIFRAILLAGDWNDPLLAAFRHFLIEHIKFDSDPEEGHGGLCRHLNPDDAIVPLWAAFRDSLVAAAPRLRNVPVNKPAP